MSKLFCLLFGFVCAFSLKLEGQNEIGTMGNKIEIYNIPEEIQEYIQGQFNDELALNNLVNYIEQIRIKDPETARFVIDQFYVQHEELFNSNDWNKIRYYNVLLKIPLYSEDEELELLLADAKVCEESFRNQQEFVWLTKSYVLLAELYYNFGFNNNHKDFENAKYYLRRASDLIKENKISRNVSEPIQAELNRIKGNICLYNIDCPIDSVLAAYEEASNIYFKLDDKIGLAKIMLNKAVAISDSIDGVNINYFVKPRDLYERAIVTLKKEESWNDVFFAQLEYSTYLGDEFIDTKSIESFNSSKEVLNEIINTRKSKKCEAYFQIAVNFQNYLSFSLAKDSEEERYLLDALVESYDQSLEYAKVESNLKYYNLIFDKLALLCPYLSEEDCTLLLHKANEVKSFFLNENKLLNTEIRKKNNRFRAAIEYEKRRNLSLKYGLFSIALVTFFFIIYQRRSIKQLRLNLVFKLEALRAQMNPHFISNSINAIESLVNQGRNDEASEYLIDFSRLCRLVLDHSKDPLIPLKDEIDTLKYFLSLEQLRLGENLSYSISIDESLNINLLMVPPMILQPFVENAIWHGIMNKIEPKKGELRIEVNNFNSKFLEYIIEDNGVGRTKSAELKKGSIVNKSSWGMSITKQRIEFLHNSKDTKLQIIDLLDSNDEPRGTKVRLQLPIIPKK